MTRVAKIDVSGVTTRQDLHEVLRAGVPFPDYYGMNWDAFDECISDVDLDLPDLILVRGIRQLSAILPREAELFRKCATEGSVVPRFEWLD